MTGLEWLDGPFECGACGEEVNDNEHIEVEGTDAATVTCPECGARSFIRQASFSTGRVGAGVD